jgi:hypothetical protein
MWILLSSKSIMSTQRKSTISASNNSNTTTSTTKPQRIFFDTDPGIDDTLALFLTLASPEIQIDAIGITMVINTQSFVFLLDEASSC